jgi:hypothetical protein
MKCPAGHESQATDYCDTCGAAMDAAAATPDAPASSDNAAAEGPTSRDAGGVADAGGDAVPEACPNCSAPHLADALFCEACGYDYTTGAMPRAENPLELGSSTADDPASPTPPQPSPSATELSGPAGSTAPVLDPPWVAEVWIDPQWYAAQESPDPLPSSGPPTVVPLRHTSLLVGRVSQSRQIHPDIDCGSDNGVSRRHAQLTTDGTRWWIEDLASSNGTFLGDAVGELPARPIPSGRKTEVAPDARIFVGSWTRIVLRAAADGEV